MKTNKELEIYIHIPFCVRKCNYCDFLSFPGCEDIHGEYVRALIREVKAYAGLYGNREVSSVFIGGGTPSILDPALTTDISETVFTSFNVAGDVEFTIESNPGTLSDKKLLSYRTAGINRISMGLQSADNDMLRKLGRIHTYEEFLDNYDKARKAGFENINIDLISGLPGESKDGFEKTLRKVTGLRPEHISSYGLIIEPGTPFFDIYGEEAEAEERKSLPSDEEERAIYYMTRDILKDAGYHQYEISNYALKGYECRHNKGYWTRKEYAGFGLGASSMYEELRYKNTPDIGEYLNADFDKNVQTVMADVSSEPFEERDELALKEIKKLSKEESMSEMMFLGLRLNDGVCKQMFYDAYGMLPKDVYGKEIAKFKAEELLDENDKYVYLTKKGMDLANYVMSAFV